MSRTRKPSVRSHHALTALIEPLELRQLLAAVLAEDLTPSPASSDPENLLTIGDITYFTANDGLHGRELWRTDGTPQGTRLVKDIHVGPSESRPTNLTNINGALYFHAYTSDTGAELWKSDGTPEGTVLLKDIYPGAASSTPANFTNVNDTLFFTANYGLWKTDGTPQGTVVVKPKFSDNGQLPNITPANLTSFNDQLFFTVNDGIHGIELWSSDGTEAGTTLFMDFLAGPANGALGPLFVRDGYLLFSGNDAALGLELFKTDGTPQGTTLAKDLTPGAYATQVRDYIEFAGQLFIQTRTDAGVYSLWKTDGTLDGTILLKQFPSQTSARGFMNLNGSLFFLTGSSTGDGPGQLWKTDGTPDGTTFIKNVGTILGKYDRADVGVANNHLFFLSQTTAEGYELWTSDGTSDGTGLFKDIYPGPTNAAPRFFATLGDRVLFRARDVSSNFEIWTSDGTNAGTHRLVEVRPSSIDTNPMYLTAAGDKLYFSANGDPNAGFGNEGVGFYVLDNASSKPTRLLPSVAWSMTPVGDTLFFNAYSGGNEFLCKTDGTPQGTTAIRSFYRPSYLADFKGTLFFYTPVGDYGLWKSDGTAQGTVRVKPLTVSNLLSVGDNLFFEAMDNTSTFGLFKSDGTSDGTLLVKEHTRSGRPRNLTNVNGTLYYIAGSTGVSDNSLWKSDGTTAGTVLIQNTNISSFTAIGDTVYFIAVNAAGPALWKTSGTPGSTTLVKPLTPDGPPPVVHPTNLTAVNNRLFFTFSDPEHGLELWTSDGTSQGTHLVQDLNPGPASSSPASLTAFRNQLYFTATDPLHGTELWRTDGTPESTVLVPELVPGTGSSAPASLTPVNNVLYFAARNATHGRELFRLSPPTANIGGPYRAATGHGVRLDASASVDPDPNETLSYAWDLDNDGLFDDATGPTPLFYRAATTGLYPISLRVTNSAGVSSVASTTVTYDYRSTSISGTNGNDLFVIELDPTGTNLKLSFNPGSPGTRSVTAPLAETVAVRIEGYGGRDTILVNAANGQPLTSLALHVAYGAYVLQLQNATELHVTGIGLLMSGTTPISTLDIRDYPLLISGDDPTRIESFLRSARNNGQWTGPGLTTSSFTNHTTLAAFPTPTGARVKLTWYGDVNADGQVNLTDYFAIDSGYLNQRQGFTNGDVNLDGEINLNDYFLIDSAYLNQTTLLSTPALSTNDVKPTLTRKLHRPRKRPSKRLQLTRAFSSAKSIW